MLDIHAYIHTVLESATLPKVVHTKKRVHILVFIFTVLPGWFALSLLACCVRHTNEVSCVSILSTISSSTFLPGAFRLHVAHGDLVEVHFAVVAGPVDKHHQEHSDQARAVHADRQTHATHTQYNNNTHIDSHRSAQERRKSEIAASGQRSHAHAYQQQAGGVR